MAVLPNVFRRSPDSTANYDWVDYISGCGYRRFYGACSMITGDVKTYFLSTTVVDSSTGASNVYADAAFYTWSNGPAIIDIDFDVTFQRPAVVGGADAILNYTVWDESTGDSAITAYIYHVTAAGVETQLGTAVSVTHTYDTSGYYRDCLKMTITQKTFAAGEKLRLTVQGNALGAGIETRLYHDPASSLSYADVLTRTVGTDMTLDIPFKIEV